VAGDFSVFGNAVAIEGQIAEVALRHRLQNRVG
jgi:hypothetical protein